MWRRGKGKTSPSQGEGQLLTWVPRAGSAHRQDMGSEASHHCPSCTAWSHGMLSISPHAQGHPLKHHVRRSPLPCQPRPAPVCSLTPAGVFRVLGRLEQTGAVFSTGFTGTGLMRLQGFAQRGEQRDRLVCGDTWDTFEGLLLHHPRTAAPSLTQQGLCDDRNISHEQVLC